MTEAKRRSIASPFGNAQGRLRSFDFAQDDTKKRIRDSSLRSRMTRELDAETRNRYRLRCAKLSEVVARTERSLATVRMTEKRGT